jgi:hypothetical protein
VCVCVCVGVRVLPHCWMDARACVCACLFVRNALRAPHLLLVVEVEQKSVRHIDHRWQTPAISGR